MSKLKKLNKLNKTKTLSVAMSVGLVAANLVNAVPVMAVAPVHAHAMSSRTTIDPAKTQSFDKKDPQDISATVTVSNEEYQLQAVKNGSKTLEEGTDYTFDGSEITISQDYLMNLKVGTASLKLDFDKGSDPIMRISVKDSRATAKLSTKTVDSKHLRNITATLTLHDDTFAGIEGLQEDSDYTVRGSRVTISKDYLATLADGENTLVFTFGDSPNVELTFTVKNSDVSPVATIKSVKDVNVTTTVGIAPNLPATVTATMSDGTTQDVDVQWGTVDVSNTGTVTVTGTIEGTTVKAKATVTVNEALPTVQSISAVNDITVDNGTTVDKLGLPAQVDVTLSDNTTAKANVTWDTAAFDGTKAGDVTINGEVSAPEDANFTVPADKAATTVKVTVKAATLAVNSVSAINATTVEVALKDAPTADPAVSAFNVLVDGSSVTVASVSKKPGTTQTYRLTIPTLDGKEGTLSVNGVSATITGSDFGYDNKIPTVASVTAVDNKHVRVAFSEKIGKTNAELVANYELTGLDGATGLPGSTDPDGGGPLSAKNPVSAALLDDGKTVSLTVSGTGMINFKNGYILTVKKNGTAANIIADIAGNALTADTATIFDGDGTASQVAPAPLSAVYDPSTSGTTARTIIAKFDQVVNSVDITKITVGGQALGVSDSVAVDGTDASKINITLSTATATAFEAATSKDVAFAAGAVKDAQSNASAAKTISVVSYATLATATYDETSNMLTLNFDQAVKPALDLTKIEVNGSAITNADIKTTSNSSSIQIDLTNATNLAAIEAAQASARKVEFKTGAAAGKNLDANNNPIALKAYTTNFTYTKSSGNPSLVSAEYIDDINRLVLTFDRPMNRTTVNRDVLMINAKDGTNLVNVEAGASITTQPANKYQIFVDLSGESAGELSALEAGTVDRTGLNLTYVANAFQDENGNKSLANTTGTPIKYTDATKQGIVLEVADADSLGNDLSSTYNDATIDTTADSTHIKVTFADKADVTSATNVANYTVAVNGSATTFAVSKVTLSNDGITAILTVADMSSYTGEVAKVTVKNVKDAAGNVMDDTTGYITIAGTAASTVGPKVSSVSFDDTNSDGIVSAGDKVDVVFDKGIYVKDSLDASIFALSNVTGSTFGTGATVAAKAGTTNTLTVTLGTNPTFNVTAGNGSRTKVDLVSDGTAALTDVYGNSALAAGTAVEVTQYTGGTAPYLTSVAYTDSNDDGAVSQDDIVILTFDEPVNLTNAGSLAENWFAGAPSIGGTNFAIAAVAGHSNQLKLTLGSNASNSDITFGTTTFEVNPVNVTTNIADKWGQAVAVATTTNKITTADSTAPKLVSVELNDNNSNGVSDAGDYVTFTFSESVSANGATLADFYITGSGSSWGTASQGLTAVSGNSKQLRATLAGTPKIAAGTTQVAVDTFATQNVQDASDNKAVFDSNKSVTAGSDLVAATKASSSDATYGAKQVTLVFNEKVKVSDLSVSDFTVIQAGGGAVVVGAAPTLTASNTDANGYATTFVYDLNGSGADGTDWATGDGIKVDATKVKDQAGNVGTGFITFSVK